MNCVLNIQMYTNINRKLICEKSVCIQVVSVKGNMEEIVTGSGCHSVSAVQVRNLKEHETRKNTFFSIGALKPKGKVLRCCVSPKKKTIQSHKRQNLTSLLTGANMRPLGKACQTQLGAENDVFGVKSKLESHRQICSTAAPKHCREEGAEPKGEAVSRDHKMVYRQMAAEMSVP